MNTFPKPTWLIAAVFSTMFSLNALAADTAPATLDSVKPKTQEQRDEQHQAMRTQWEKMSPEERQAMHEVMREEMHKKSAGQCPAGHEKMRKQLGNMTPQQREERHRAMHEKMHIDGKPCNHQSGNCPYDKAGAPGKSE